MSHPELSYDYIAAIAKTDSGFKTITVPIIKPTKLLGELKAMAESSNSTIYDMQCKFEQEYHYTYDYIPTCLLFSYRNSYLSGFHAPKIYTYAEFQQSWEKSKQRIIEKLEEESKTKNIPFILEDSERLAKELEELKCRKKYDYYICIKQWIDAVELQNESERLSTNPNIMMFSRDDIGEHEYKHSLTDDLAIAVHTNFGYGSASHFYIAVQYKDLDILPYSYLVKYYNLGYNNTGCRKHVFRPVRESWEPALNLATEIANNAKDEPEQYILNEVREMMQGLQLIYSNPEAVRQNIMYTKASEHVSSISDINPIEEKKIRAYPQESILLFKVEKIVGALELLKSLQQFAVYIEEISLYIKQLIDLNKELLPEINSMISLIESKIATTESEFSKQNEERNHIQESLNQHKMEIQQRERSCMTGQNERKYELEYPEYRFLKIKDTNLKDAIEESVRKLNDYSRFLKQLKKAQKGIEGISYAIV